MCWRAAIYKIPIPLYKLTECMPIMIVKIIMIIIIVTIIIIIKVIIIIIIIIT